MATTYTSTIQVRCWKQHVCVGCGGSYMYEFVRSIKGSAGTAEKARQNAQRNVDKALATDTDLHPCPTCGLHQPDMIAQRRENRHWIMFWCALILAAVLLILVATHTVQSYVATWLALTLCIGAGVASFLAERWNPNRDVAQNRQRAADLVSRGVLRQQPGQPSPEVERLARPGMSAFQLVALLLLPVAMLAVLVPEVARLASGWPVNDDAYPPVVGPGDEARIYMRQSISSVKGYWRGKPEVTIRDGSRHLTAKATTNQNDWGSSIYAKSSEKDTSSTPWVAVTLPGEGKLAGKTVGCDIDLNVEYPSASGSSSFRTANSKMHRSVKLVLASAGAGDTYTAVWWGSTLGGLVLSLVAGVFLVVVARGLRKTARPTQVFAPNG